MDLTSRKRIWRNTNEQCEKNLCREKTGIRCAGEGAESGNSKLPWNWRGRRSARTDTLFIRYDVENISDETYEKAIRAVFSEPPVDLVYEETFPLGEAVSFSVEYLPGQFDQRADSAQQCVKLLNENEEPAIRSAVTYVIGGNLTQEQLAAQVGVRRETIMRLEKAQYNPSLKLAMDISKAVEAPIEALFIFTE